MGIDRLFNASRVWKGFLEISGLSQAQSHYATLRIVPNSIRIWHVSNEGGFLWLLPNRH